MQCPACNEVKLLMSDRQGIEIDYCPECRGVWLDRGELDKLIERSSTSAAPQKHAERESEKHDRGSHDYDKKRKKKSFLGELLDF